jgi:hypothetical protein
MVPQIRPLPLPPASSPIGFVDIIVQLDAVHGVKEMGYIITYLNCKWVFTRWQWYNKTQHTNDTHHTK